MAENNNENRPSPDPAITSTMVMYRETMTESKRVCTLSYGKTLSFLRDRHVTWDKAMEFRDLPESQLNEDALREYLKEAPVELRINNGPSDD